MKSWLLIFMALVGFGAVAQKEKPKNYRKFDERLFHFGFMLGANSSGYSLSPKVDAYQQYGLKGMTVKSQPGAQLGILTTMKIGTPMVRLRFIPSLSFQERVINQVFVNPADLEKDILNEERINATSLDFPLMFQFRTLRLNNFAAYCLVGGQYSLDLQSQQDAAQQFDDPFIKMKKHDVLGQVGAGVEFFAPFFKFGIEIKYSHSFMNGFIQDNTRSSLPIDKIYNSGWIFSIIFEG
ncbi:PorT family protein [Crocinitomicaceae bacterium CZZ-1]|uniref:PorT family protein n=1 Tax=Taishania pollutisoli TaxID=2766479 RepID=A0A8J6PMW6_9FLAO|nr:porin family protein [Taishania pollutisoli]MBC9811103.1 PorT family protein [Taishania pollutisoli]MBX2947982.1 PorT family protein [Crocinitomicaceae bacterium]NGF76798.1 PorT family protein [Fluviicola sp. SGL-29]